MAAGPVLSVFPRVEQVNRRQESLDNLIKKSMDMRPTGPWPQRNDNQLPVAKTTKAQTRRDGCESRFDIKPTMEDEVRDDSRAGTTLLPPWEKDSTISRRANSPPKPTPFQMLPPIQVPKQNHTRPRRNSPVDDRSRRKAPTSSPARRRAITASVVMRHQTSADHSDRVVTPATANDNINTPISAQSSNYTPISTQSSKSTPISTPERDLPSRTSNRQRLVSSSPSHGSETAAHRTPITHVLPERKVSSRASNRSKSSQVSFQRQLCSTAPHPSNTAHRPSPGNKRYVTPTISEADSAYSGSPTLVRSNSAMTHSRWAPQGNQESVQMRSMFPVYDTRVPWAHQSYRPAHIQPLVLISPEKVSKPEYSPALREEVRNKNDLASITPVSDLSCLWNAANGQMSALNPRTFALKMYRPIDSDVIGKNITFGSTESSPFYSLAKSHPAKLGEDDEQHELLISRHHPSKEDILPVSHLHLQTPPPPTTSKSGRASVISDPHQPASHITTITPILATLHSLDSAAKTPQAHTLALVDPNATSPAATRLAERAVAEAMARERCSLSWTPTCPRTGKYELHHPSLGVFTIRIFGDVGSALEKGQAKRPTSISIVNPFANVKLSTTAPTSLETTSDTYSTENEKERNAAVIACLDLQEDMMYIDAASIQQLGNLYLIDVCVSAILAVAVAEAKRPVDPGLIFAAPPPSLLSLKSKKTKGVVPKEAKKVKKIKPGTLGLGFEHLLHEEDLPRITKGILSVLGFSFKTAVYLLAISVKVTASMVIGISKMATKD